MSDLEKNPELRRDVAAFLKPLFDQAEREERALRHVILCFDPETGRRWALGPYRNHFEARIAAIIHAENFRRAELDEVQLDLIPLEPGLGKEQP